MASSTTFVDQLATSQSSKEARINELTDAASPALLFGRHASATSGLVWGYFGGTIPINGVETAIPNGTVILTNVTQYVEAAIDGTVSVASSRSPDKAPLYTVVASGGLVTSYTDERDSVLLKRLFYGRFTLAMVDVNKTLTQAQALCDSGEYTGVLTAMRDVILPTVRRRYTVFANVTGGFGVRVKTSGGTGIIVADGKRQQLECDGVNVVAIGSAV